MSVERNDLTNGEQGKHFHTVFCTTCGLRIIDMKNPSVSKQGALETANSSQCNNDGHLVLVTTRTGSQIEQAINSLNRNFVLTEAEQVAYDKWH